MLIDKLPRSEVTSKEPIERSVQATNYLMREQQIGPQSEEFEDCDLEAALNDERTVCIDVDGINIPILIPIDKLNDYKIEYIKEQNFDVDTTYFMPIYVGLLDKAPDIKGLILNELKIKHSQNTSHIFVYPHEENELEKEYIKEILDDYSEVELIDKRNNSSNCITHFEGLVKPVNENNKKLAYSSLRDVYIDLVEKGELKIDTENGVLVLDPEELKNNKILQDQIWNLCISRFDDLEEGFPFNQGFDRDEFFEYVLLNPMTTTIVHKTSGVLDCVATFMHDIKNTPWLNDKFYSERYSEELLSYFVMIAKAQEASGRLSMELISMLVKLTQETERNMWVTFECTNISAEYVPRIVSMVVNSSDVLKIDINQTAHYPIRVFEIKDEL